MKFLVDIFIGIIIGMASIMPGVSGGSMMVSMGIYEKIISAVNNLFKQFAKSVRTLMPLGIGLGIGVVIYCFIFPYFLKEFPFPTSFCFMGLILGGIPAIIKPAKESLAKENKKFSITHVVSFVVLFLISVGTTVMNGAEINSATMELSPIAIVLLFIAGVIAAATLVIPGVSGTVILLIIGIYYVLTDSITGFIKSVLSFDWNAIFHYAGILIPFGIGLVAGVFAVAKLMEWLFVKYRSITYCGILGLVASSPIAIILEMGNKNINAFTVILGIVLLVAATWFTYWFGKKTEGME